MNRQKALIQPSVHSGLRPSLRLPAGLMALAFVNSVKGQS